MIKAAFATDDGKIIIDRHFGDADYFDIYSIDEENCTFLKKIKNKPEDNDEHADSGKAKNISSVLCSQDVDTLVSGAFGPNIVHVRKKFVCVVTGKGNITALLKKIQKNIQTIEKEWLKGETRSHLIMRD